MSPTQLITAAENRLVANVVYDDAAHPKGLSTLATIVADNLSPNSSPSDEFGDSRRFRRLSATVAEFGSRILLCDGSL